MVKLSVCIVTYNHAKCIAQCIDSVLMQKTNFLFEIIVGEDDSKDGTRDIVKKYKARYPHKIKLLLNKREDVIYVDGEPTSAKNFVNVLKNARGQYIALLDGDDYWTNPDKLQKQVDFLEEHSECVMCCHPVLFKFEDGRPELCKPDVLKEFYTIEDVLKGTYIATSSVVFKTGLIKEFPDWFYKLKMGDRPLYFLLTQYGKIGSLNEVMGVYRFHSGGTWSTKTIDLRRDAVIKMYEYIYDYVMADPVLRLNRNIIGIVADGYLHLAHLYKGRNNFAKAKSSVYKCLNLSPFCRGIACRSFFKGLLKLYLPPIYGIGRHIRKLWRGLYAVSMKLSAL